MNFCRILEKVLRPQLNRKCCCSFKGNKIEKGKMDRGVSAKSPSSSHCGDSNATVAMDAASPCRSPAPRCRSPPHLPRVDKSMPCSSLFSPPLLPQTLTLGGAPPGPPLAAATAVMVAVVSGHLTSSQHRPELCLAVLHLCADGIDMGQPHSSAPRRSFPASGRPSCTDSSPAVLPDLLRQRQPLQGEHALLLGPSSLSLSPRQAAAP